MDWSSFIAGVFVATLLELAFYRVRKAVVASKVKPPREVGDLLLDDTGMPILLLEKISQGKFRVCYITPDAKSFGAAAEKDSKINELETFLIWEVNNYDIWKTYPHPLSDKEHANYAQAMLQGQK